MKPARAAYLDEACADDPEIRAQIDGLLAADFETDVEFGTSDPFGWWHQIELSKPPEYIGPYRIIDRIGAGGMGTVYEAEQSSPRRTVALKVITPGQEACAITRRFRQEAELLGRLQHKGIAQNLRGGFV